MSNAFNQLIRAVPPPMNPIFNTGSWQEFEGRTGIIFPTDYKKIIETYGAGHFGRFVGLFDPFFPYSGFEGRPSKALEDLFETFSSFELEFGMPRSNMFPSTNGLLPCGTCDGYSDILCYRVGMPGSEWSLVWAKFEMHRLFEFKDECMSSLLLKVVSGAFSWLPNPPSIFEVHLMRE